MSKKLLQDSGIETLSFLPFQTECGKAACYEILQTATIPNGIRKAQKRQEFINCLRKLPEKESEQWKELFQELSFFEKEIADAKEKNSEVLKDTIGQITFQHEEFRHLNYIPFVLVLLSIFKIYVVPTLAILSPFLTILLPYFFVYYSKKIPLSFSSYLKLVWSMWAGNSEGFTLRSSFQSMTILFTVLQGIIQPIQNAKHCANTDTYLQSLGASLFGAHQIARKLEESCSRNKLPFEFPKGFQDTFSTDTRQLAVSFLENPLQYTSLFKLLGKLECLFVLSQESIFQPVSFLKPSATPSLQISGLQDLQISSEKRVLSSISLLSQNHHSLLTGPNGGGKSSSLRAILQSILFAQSFGYAAVESMTLRPFRWIFSGLLLQDNPGKKSMFESEVRFAASLLKKRDGPGLVLFDELFHSTNPPDGIRTASCFLKNLWKKSNIASIVSTHVFELVEEAPNSIQKLCVPGVRKEDGTFSFSYKLQPGICTLSSVELIWKQEGLKCG